jgi:hypothetical protein
VKETAISSFRPISVSSLNQMVTCRFDKVFVGFEGRMTATGAKGL